MIKKITLFIAICLSFLAQDLIAQCIPAGASTVFGTVTASTGTFTFNNMPTGNVVQLSAPATGTFYTISMCNTNGGVAQADGIDDSQLTVLDVNSAAATSLAFNDDFCPTTGANGYGPSEVSYTSTAAGNVFVYLTEWDASGLNNCIADGVNNSYTMTVTVSGAAPTCEAGTLTSALTQTVCPGQTGTIASTGNSTPGDYSVGFAPGTTGTGGTGGPITLTGVTSLPYTFDNDLNGVLSGQTTPLPPLDGEWILTLFATDGTGFNCDSTVTTSVTFLDAADPACGGSGLDVSITSVNSNAISQSSLFSATQFLISDFSDRTNFTSSTVIQNTGTAALDSLYLRYILVDDIGAPTAGVIFVDSIEISPALAVGASYTHNFAPQNITTLFPTLATDDVLDFIVVADSSAYNGSQKFEQFLLVAPTVSYSAPYATSFEVADLSAGIFLFDHDTWGWKYFDNDADGVSFDVSQAFTNIVAQDDSMQVYGSLIGATIEVGADDDFMESPELTLNAGQAYDFSIWAKTGFGETAAVSMTLVNGAGATVTTLGAINLAIADSVHQKFTFSYTPSATATDYKVQINKNATGFIVLDLFELELSTVVPCSITNLAAATQTPCMAATNQYTQDVTVTYTNAPGSGMLNVNGQMFAIGTSPQTVTLTGLNSDGLAVNVTASFTAAGACTLTQNALFTAPANCQAVCTISDLAPGAQTPCVNTTNLYTQDVVVTYSTPPSTGMLSVNGQMFAIGTSPQTVTLTGLNSDGLAVNVTALFTTNTACDYTENAVFTAPASCLCPTISVNVMTTDVTNCSSPDGSAMANASGGVAPYTYAWTPSTFGNGQTIMNIPSGTYSVIATDVNGCAGNGSGSVTNTSGINALISGTMNVSCPGGNNGAISITPSGGTGTISYTWSDQGFASTVASRTDLTAGSYTIVVSDGGGCSVTLGPIVISQPNPISITLANSSNISCNGLSDGQINMDVTGGTTNYSYAWSGSTSTMEDLSNIGAGVYQLTVTDANSCTAVGPSVTITQPTALSLSTNTPIDVSCNGANDGSFIAVANGGTAPYMFSANGGTQQGNGSFVGLSGNTYTPMVSDANGCSANAAPVAIIEPAAIVVSIDASSNVSCNGANDGAIDVTVTGAQGTLIYNWGAGNPTTEDLSLLGPGAYVLNVTDANGCAASSGSTNITEPAILVLATSSSDESSSSAGDGTATVASSGGTAPYTYSWDDPSAQTTAMASALNAGTYNVTVTDANGCSEMASVVVDLGNGIKQITLQDFTVYPNPANKNVVVTFEVQKNTDLSINFYNTIGNLLMSDKVSVSSHYKKSFDISSLAAGIYFVEIQSEAGKAIKKLTVTK